MYTGGEEVWSQRRKQMNDDLHNLHDTQNIMNMINARRMRQEGNVARMGAM